MKDERNLVSSFNDSGLIPCDSINFHGMTPVVRVGDAQLVCSVPLNQSNTKIIIYIDRFVIHLSGKYRVDALHAMSFI